MSARAKFQVHLKTSYLAKYNNSERTVMLNIYLKCKKRLSTETFLLELCWRRNYKSHHKNEAIYSGHKPCDASGLSG